MAEGGEKASGSTPTVFVSYASQDAAVANAVVENLEQCGLGCWLAPRDVRPGAQYADAIVRAINEAKAVVLVLSSSAIGSDHVAREVERAASKHKPIIAFRIDSAVLNPGLEYFLSNSQWIDVSAIGTQAALAKLAEAARQGSEQTVAAGSEASAMPLKRTGGRAKLLAGTAVLIIVGVAVVLGLHSWSQRHKAEQPAAAVAITDKSIAVLPFVDMSEKKDQEYFADGMSEEILDLLAKIPGLTVIGRTSSFQFKGKNADLRTIGTQLNAAHVLEGSVRKSGDHVRITAQLINTRTGAHEWSETYDRQIGDVLKLQGAIASAVVRELQLTVAPEYLVSRATVKNGDSYDLILRGRHAVDLENKEGLDEAVMLFQQALDRDPTSSDAAANLAYAYVGQVTVGALAPAAGFERARLAAVNALKLDPQNVLANVAMANIYLRYDWDWAGAERLIKHSAPLAPGNVELLLAEATLSSILGRWDDALKQTRAALARDPLNPFALLTIEGVQDARGRLVEAEAAARRWLDIRPTSDYGHYNLGLVLLERGDRNAALLEMQQETNELGKQEGLALIYFAQGRKAESNAVLAGMLKEQAEENALGIAEVYAFSGQGDEAMHWLERAYALKDPYLCDIKGNPFLKNLVGDPRYKAFLRKMNLPE
jgi:TolB-like protein